MPDPIVPKFSSFKPKISSSKKPKRDYERRSDSHCRDHEELPRQRSFERHHRQKLGDDDQLKRRSGHYHHSRRLESQDLERRSEDVIAADEFEESNLFIIDKRGDRKNVEYGSLHRYSVPSYFRVGYGRLLGAPTYVKLDREKSTVSSAVLSSVERGSHEGTDRPLKSHTLQLDGKRLRLVASQSMTDELEYQADYIALPTLKRKRGSDSPEAMSSDGADYRSIEGKAKTDTRPVDEELDMYSDGDLDESTNGLDLQIREINAVLSGRTREYPNDVEGWLKLIEHQAKVMRSDANNLTHFERRAVADVRVTIYEQALKHFQKGGHGHELLILGLLAEGRLIWDNKKLAERWTEVLKGYPSNIMLWTSYLDFVQSNHTDFRFEKCKAAYVRCLKILHSAQHSSHRGSEDISQVQVYILLRLTVFIRDAGYDELAHGIWQILLEYHFSEDSDLADPIDNLGRLEDFWDADIPRIGEDGALGLSSFVLAGDRTTGRHGHEANSDPINPQRPFQSFADYEAELLGKLHLPACNDDGLDSDDPYRHVMFSDMRDILETLLEELPALDLINAYLTFMQLPPLPCDVSNSWTREWQNDQYLRHNLRPELESADIESFQQTTFTLFNDAFASFQNRMSKLEAAGLALIDFVTRVIERLVAANSEDDALAEYYLAYKLSVSPLYAPKTAKQLLKSRSSGLRLYNAYALIQSRLGNSAKAKEVWVTAINMSSTLPNEVKESSVKLWHSWMLTLVENGDDVGALRCLLAMLDGNPKLMEEFSEDLGVSAAQRLKATRYFEERWESMTYQGKYSLAALHAECHMWFAYVADDRSLESADQIIGRYISRLEDDRSTSAEECLYQAQVALIMKHLAQHRPYKPAKIRAALANGLGKFPSNSLLLGLHIRIETHFRIEDRIRSSISSDVLDTAKATVISWSSAVVEETHRYDAVVFGTTENSIRAKFRRALLGPDSTVKHSVALWMMWLQFESPTGHNLLKPINADTEIQRASALERAKQVFLDGLRYLPWSKSWIIMGLYLFSNEGGVSSSELRKVYNVLLERELRVRSSTDEMEDAIESLGEF